MRKYSITIDQNARTYSDAVEWSIARLHNITRTAHDSSRYDLHSDVEAGNKRISVKTSRFTLMSGTLCKGYTEFDKIWELYEATTHSNVFAYGTQDGTVYEMDIKEFKSFVYKFCQLEKDSSKNGGNAKIRAKRENKEMREWLERAALA